MSGRREGHPVNLNALPPIGLLRHAPARYEPVHALDRPSGSLFVGKDSLEIAKA
jgi:hypothetical protein